MSAKWSGRRWGTEHEPEPDTRPEVANVPLRKFMAEFNGQRYFFTARDGYEAVAVACAHWPKRVWGTPGVQEFA